MIFMCQIHLIYWRENLFDVKHEYNYKYVGEFVGVLSIPVENYLALAVDPP